MNQNDFAQPEPPSLISTKPATSGMAIAALVTGVLCVPLVPVVLGIIALTKVNKSGSRLGGGGMAIAGIVLGCMQVILIPAVAGLAVPAILRAKNTADLTQATNNLRNLGVSLLQFEQDWGTFPSEQVLRENPEKFPGVRPGESSNALLSMLVAGGYANSEEMLQAKGGSAVNRRADNVTTPPARLLEPGECGFGYVMVQGGKAMTSSANGGRPLLVAPLQPGSGGANPKFNRLPYGHRATYLRIDSSVQWRQIDDHGRVVLSGNMSLFEPGPDTVWGDDIPDVRPPE